MAAGQVPTRRGSGFEDYQVELMEARGVGEELDFDDLSAPDREAEDDARLPARGPYGSHGSVHQGRLCDPGTPLEGLGDGRRAADLSRSPHLDGSAVGSEHDVRAAWGTFGYFADADGYLWNVAIGYGETPNSAE